MKKFDVVILDSGANQQDESYLSIVNLCDNATNTNDSINHGTDVTQMIHNASPKAQILMIKICDSFDFHYNAIFKAFDYLIQNNIEFDILNLSLGAKYANKKRFKDYIDHFVQLGAVIVAANNNDTMSHPAFYENVIGVDVSNTIRDSKQFIYCKNSTINIIGSNNYFRIKGKDGTSINQGTSFITAYISGLLSNYFISSGNYDGDKLLLAHSYLEKIAISTIIGCKPQTDRGSAFIGDVKKAIVFPFNKEIFHIANNEDLIPFEIVGYYDFDISLNNNRYIDEIVANGRHELIKAFNEIDWDADFDTIICGHCIEYEQLTNKPLLSRILEICKDKGKKVYCFDYIPENNFQGNICYFPHITRMMLGTNYGGKLFNINRPVVAIMGTSSVQGKYGLQLSLRREFLKYGYKVCSIGTEPSGYIFGFKQVIPIGYNSHMDMTSSEFIQYVNFTMKKAEDEDNDIIFIGSQSGTAPITNNNINYLHLRQHELLLGSNPDAVVLCVNYFDSINHIKKTIKLIEGLSSAKVISLVVSALEHPNTGLSMRSRRRLLTEKEMDSHVRRIKTQVGIEVYSMLDTIEPICKQIIEYFSE